VHPLAGLGATLGLLDAATLAALDDAAFAAALARASEWRLGEVLAVDARACVPLRGLHAARYIAPRVALAGDAAHVVHPLAGLGATLGLLDAATLAELVTGARARHADPGGATLLRRYERTRRTANAPVEVAIEGLRRLYGTPAGPVAAVRRTGLALAGRSGPLRALLAARASALAGELPALAR
jgi:2-polyprenylphenol 6-hydroxylase